MTFEEEFDILIQDDDAGDMSTVQDAIDYIAKMQKS
jgi:acyl carrier protein